MQAKDRKKYIYVDTNAAVEDLTNRVKNSDRIAIDIEADSMHHYYEKVCLIQLSLPDDTNYILDPLSGSDLTGFMDTLADTTIVLHDSAYDLRMLRASFDFQPRAEVFDTMLGAQLLGYRKFGLAAMIERFFGIVFSKNIQKSDWSRRPLSAKQLEYACDDTRFLLQMSDKLYEKLHELQRHQWHRESCQRAVNAASVEKATPDPDRIWRIKGLAPLGRKKLALVREIWHWRENQAQQADIPPFKIMPHPLIIELAIWAEDNPSASISSGPRLPRSCKGLQRQLLKDAMQQAHNMAKSEWPQRSKSTGSRPSVPDLTPQINALRKECSDLAAQLKIAPQIIASRASLEAVVRKNARTVDDITGLGQLMQWQAELILPVALKITEAN